MVRAPFYDNNGLKKGAWSPEEDDKLKAYIHKNGLSNWRELPTLAGLLRCGKSCRLRWMNYLRPDVKRGNYSKEEEELIMKLHEKHGNKWSVIAAELPGRTDNEIKNYWHTRIKKLQKTKLIADHYDEASNFKSSSKSETRISSAAEMPHLILESLTLSPVLTTECSNVCSNYQESGAEDSVASTLRFEALDGDFWEMPFIPDNYDIQTESIPMWFTDAEDLLYQAMKELPENYEF